MKDIFSYLIFLPFSSLLLKRKTQAQEDQQQRFVHSKRIIVFEDLLQTRLCGSRGEKSSSANRERLCLPPDGRMKRKCLMFLSIVLPSEERGLVEMFDTKPGKKFENLTSGLYICGFHLLQFNPEVT